MSKTITFWLIWLLAWGASGSHAQQCAQAGNQLVVQSIQGSCGAPAAAVPAQAATCQQQTTTTTTYISQATITATGSATIKSITVTPGYASVALHEFVYQNNFAGFREKMKSWDNRESLPQLVGALQTADDKGMTVAHLLACSGRSEELLQLTQAVAKQKEHLGQLPHSIFKRVVFESLSLNASCTTCRPDRAEFEVVPHVRLELTDPQQTVFLYGNVTPVECAAAHGHVKAMNLLMQQGVAPGRVLMVAQHFGLGNQLLEAVQQAKAEGATGGAELHSDLPKSLDAPLRKPRQRRTDKKTKSKPESSANASGTSQQQVSQPQQQGSCSVQPQQQDQCQVQQQQTTCTAQQQQQVTCNAPPQQQASCKAQPPLLQLAPDEGVSQPGAPAHVIGTVSTSILGARVPDDPNKPARTPTKLSEAMDVTALWLLSSMLLFPAWSTICLLWRKAGKRKAALQESATKVKRTGVNPFQRRGSSGSGTPAVVATTAAEGGHPVPQRSSGSESKQTNKPAAAAAAANKQQRKPGPSGTVAGPTVEPRAPTKAGWFGGLFRTKSAPEAAVKSNLKSTPGLTQTASAPVRRHASAVGAVTTPRASSASASGGAVLYSVASSSAAATAATKTSADKGGAVPSSKDRSSAVVGPAVAAPSSEPTPATTQAANKQRSSKPAAAAVASVVPAKVKEGSKGSSSKAASSNSAVKKPSSAVSSAAGDVLTAAAAQRTAGQTQPGDSSSNRRENVASPAAVKLPKVLHRSSKVDSSGTGSPAATSSGGSSSTHQPATNSEGHKAAATHSLAAAKAASKSGAAASRTVGSSSSTHNGVTATPLSPAATKHGRHSPSAEDSFCLNSPTSSSRAGHFAGGVRRVHTANITMHSPPGRAPPCERHSVVSPSGSSGSSSKRFTVSAAAAAAAAVRDAAAAAAAATASIQRTASRSASLSPRAPLMDLYDVLARCRDQDQHRAYAALTEADEPEEGAEDADDEAGEASVPSRNAWTPAAAAARAARAGGGSGKGEEHLNGADSETQSESGVAEVVASSAADTAADAAGSAAATRSALAAGVLPSADSAAVAADAVVQQRTALSARDSSLNAAQAAAATAYAAAVSVLPSEAGMDRAPTHDSSSRGLNAAVQDPPVSLLPADLMLSLDGTSSGPVPRSAGTLEPRVSASALEPKTVQDLADLVATSIAQEVARGKQATEQQGSPPAAAAGTDASAGEATAGASGTAAGSSQLTDLSGAQLVHKSLDEVFAQLTANTSMPASQQSSAVQLPSTSDKQEVRRDFSNFSGSSLFGDLARISIGRDRVSDSDQPQQQLKQLDIQVPPPGQQPTTQQQQQQQPGGWFGSSTAITGAMQATAGPPGLLPAAQVPSHAMNTMNGVSLGAMNMSGPMSGPGLHAQSLTAMQQQQQVNAQLQQQQLQQQQGMQQQQQGMQQQLQQQQTMQQQGMQQGMQQQLVQPMQPMLVNINSGQQQPMQIQQQGMQQPLQVQQQGMQQPMQVQQQGMQQPMQAQQLVNLGPATSAGHQGPQLIRLANGQVIQAQIISMPNNMAGAGSQLSMPGPAVAAGGGPLIITQGNGMNMQQQQNMNMQQQHINMNVMGPQQQQQQQQAQVVQVFYPQALAQGGNAGGGQMMGSLGGGAQVQMVSGSPSQQQQVMMSHPQVTHVNVQLPGGLVQAIPVSQVHMGGINGINAPSSGPMMMAPSGHMVMSGSMSSGQAQQQVTGMPMQRQHQQVQGIQRAAQMFAAGSPDTVNSGHNNLISLSSSPAHSNLQNRPQVAAPAAGATAAQAQQQQQPAGSGGGDAGRQAGAAAAAAGSSGGGSNSSSSGGGSARVVVLEAPAGPNAGPGIWSRPTESAQMAAALDELLNQANQEMGWSSVPKGQGPAAAKGN